ncbi:MAG: ABC transporter ATP-binding protein [Prevotella sp.]|nr:ABC transporter ATP-binding protein [Prevotella sp.]
MNTIVIKDLHIGYADKIVANGLNGEVRGGQLTALVGTNGVGKSTLLRTLAGLLPALGGTMLIADDKGNSRSVEELSKREMARTVSVVLTAQPDIRHITVGEVVAMGRIPYTGFFGTLSNDDQGIVDESLAITGITKFAQRQFHALSDGERQKVMAAKALAQQTPIIILDEPTAFLDYPTKVETMKTLRRLANDLGKTILLSTHDLGLALHHADRLLLLSEDLREISKSELQTYIQNQN